MVILVVFLTAFHVVNAIASPSIRKTGDVPPLDELDRLIEFRAAKISGFVLGVAVISWCLVTAIGAPALGMQELAERATADVAGSANFSIPVTYVLLAIHALFAGFVLANIVYYGSIVFAYRRLAHG